MAYHENLGLLADKPTVVLDIGTAYLKCGFSAELSPRCILKTDELLASVCSAPTTLIDLAYGGQEEYDRLVDVFYKIFFRHLLVTPKDRRVVIVDNILSPSAFRSRVANVLFQHYSITSLAFVPQPLCSCLPLGRQTALVVDVGYQQTQVVPVYDGVPLVQLVKWSTVAARLLHRRIKELLEDHCKVSVGQTEVSIKEHAALLTEDILEDIKVKCCFVTHRDRGLLYQQAENGKAVQLPSPPPKVDYPLDGEKLLFIEGIVRESAAEVLFQWDEDDESVQQLILSTVEACPIDLRRSMMENIVVVGGGCMLPGFMARLKAELLHSFSDTANSLSLREVKFFKVVAKENCMSWVGGAVFGSLEILPYRSVSRADYENNPRIRDWTDLHAVNGSHNS